MPESQRRPRRETRAGRSHTLPSPRACALVAVLCAFAPAAAQVGPASAAVNPSCTRDSALSLARQQLDASKLVDDQVRRVAVMVRAADLLWTHERQRARAAFAEAFELAAANFKEKGDEPKRDGLAFQITTPDQRYVVVDAVARRDPAWAKRLTEQLLKRDAEEAESSAARNPQRDLRTASKLLELAASLLPSDFESSLAYARISLRYPGSFQLATFLYELAEVNQTAADQFYREALAAYRERPLGEFLYLSAYPFGNDTAAADMPVHGYYRVPAAFAPDKSVQRSFLRALLARARRAVEGRADEAGFSGVTGEGQLWMALTRLEQQVQQSTPELSEPLRQARAGLYGLLSQETQASVHSGVSRKEGVEPGFDEGLAAAERQRDPGRRDQLLVSAVLGAPESAELEPLLAAADKIDNPNVRRQVLNWFYFSRAQAATRSKRFDDARRLAARVEELDQRAYLYAEVAKAMMSQAETQARELLEELLAAAGKAPDTAVKARTLLAAAHLYAKLDPARSVSVLSEAVSTLNRVDSPDFSRQSLIRRIEGRNFARYATFQTPDFNPEAVFRELAKVDFDLAVSHANNVADRALRAHVLLALADECLRDAAARQKAEPAAKKPGP